MARAKCSVGKIQKELLNSDDPLVRSAAKKDADNQKALDGDPIKIFEKLQKWVFDAQYDVKKGLYDEGAAGEVVVRAVELSAGGSAEGDVQYTQAEDEVLAGLTKEEYQLFGNLTNNLRIEAIDANKKIVAQNTIRDGAIGEVLEVDTKEGMARAKKILGDERTAKMVKQMIKAPGKGTYITIIVQSDLAKEKFAFRKYKTEEEAQAEADKQIDKVLKDSQIIHPMGKTAAEAKKWRQDLFKINPVVYRKLHHRSKKYFKIFSDQLTLMRKEGLISQQDYDNMEKVGDYSPRRYIQYLDAHNEQNALEQLTTGSSQAVLTDPAVLLKDYIIRLYDRVARNRSASELWSFMKANPDNKLVREGKLVGGTLYTMDDKVVGGLYGKIHVKINGKDHVMIMKKELADQWNRFDPLWNSNQVRGWSWVSGTPVLKAMATGLNPGFMIVNLPMDMFFSWFRSKGDYSNKAPVGFFQLSSDMIKVSGDVWHRGDKPIGRALKYLKEGGMMSFLTAQGLHKDKGSLSFMITHPKLRAAEKALSFFGQRSELWVRLAVRERVLRNRTKNGKLPETEDMRKEATWIARKYLDFAQGGSFAKPIDKFFPYLNAQLRATHGMFETMKNDPASATWKMSSFFGLTAALYVTNMLFHPEMMEGMDDKDYGTYIPIPMPWLDEDIGEGGKNRAYFKIRIDPGQAAVQSLVMLMFAKMMKTFNGATGLDLGIDERVWNIREEPLIQNIKNIVPLLGNAPPTLKAAAALFFNYDVWRGRENYRGPKVTDKSAEVMWNTHPVFAKGFKWLKEFTGDKDDPTSGLQASPANMQLAISQILAPSNSVIKLVNVSTMGIDHVLTHATDAEQREINKALKFERANFLRRFPFVSRLLSYSREENRASVKRSQQIREDDASVKQHVQNEVNARMSELNRLNPEMKNTKEYKDAKALIIKKATVAINKSSLTELQKNRMKGSVKKQIEFKDTVGHVHDSMFWRTVSYEKDKSIQAHQVVNEMLHSSPERRERLYATLQKLPMYNNAFRKEFISMAKKYKLIP